MQPEVLLDRDLGRWGKYLKEFKKARGSRSGKGFLSGLKQTRISHLFIHSWASYLIIHIQVFTSMVRTSRGDHKYSHKNILARKKPPVVTHHSFPHSAPGSPRSRLGVCCQHCTDGTIPAPSRCSIRSPRSADSTTSTLFTPPKQSGKEWGSPGVALWKQRLS